MTRIEKAVKMVSDLYDFYRKIPRVSNSITVKSEEPKQALQPTAPESALPSFERPLARRR